MIPRTPNRPRGFTLIEVLIVLTVISVLAVIAVPSYNESIQRSERASARAALLAAAQWMERHYSANNSYCAAGGCGSDPLPASLKQSPSSGTAVYTILATTPATNRYMLTAEPVGGRRMASDACGSLTLDNVGTKGQTGLTGATGLQRCWNR